jgi:membrane protein implicated in regulation of membrane protease activity
MFTSIAGVLLLLASFVVTFVAARFLRRLWRTHQHTKAEQAARAGESRQVRRARERREAK